MDLLIRFIIGILHKWFLIINNTDNNMMVNIGACIIVSLILWQLGSFTIAGTLAYMIGYFLDHLLRFLFRFIDK